ncbi:MAG TPA: class III signal peptide-containing protein [archaeon]|nr:class III signal peptide-containing protein [archaeon]
MGFHAVARGQTAIEFSFILGVVLVIAMITASIAISTFYEPLADAVFREELQKQLTNYNLDNQTNYFVCDIFVKEFPTGIIEYRAGICPNPTGQDFVDAVDKLSIANEVKAKTRYKDVAITLKSDEDYCYNVDPAEPNTYRCLACKVNLAGNPVEGSSIDCRQLPE